MQYITKPAARTALIRLVRMLTNVLRIPPDPMELVRLFTRDSTTKIPRYSAVMPRELTWAVRSSSLVSSFKRLRSTIAAIMQWASSSLFGEKPETAVKKTSCLRAVYHAFSQMARVRNPGKFHGKSGKDMEKRNKPNKKRDYFRKKSCSLSGHF